MKKLILENNVLKAADGYVFYNKADEENEEKQYSVIAYLGIYDSIDNYVAVPHTEDMEVL